jgi:hypothetical protein
MPTLTEDFRHEEEVTVQEEGSTICKRDDIESRIASENP